LAITAYLTEQFPLVTPALSSDRSNMRLDELQQ
jgi:hypothetical protein